MSEKAIEAALPLPCPFCGAEMVLQGDYTLEAAWNFYAHKDLIDSECFLAEHKVYCGSDYITPKPDELRAWNNRPALPPLRAREEIEHLLENFIVLRFPPRGKVAGQQFTMRTLPDWLSEDEWFLARRAFTDAILSSTAGQEWRDISAIREWFDKHDAYHKALDSYNARLAFVKERRELDDWEPTVHAEYRILNDAQKAAIAAAETLYQTLKPLPAPPVAEPLLAEERTETE